MKRSLITTTLSMALLGAFAVQAQQAAPPAPSQAPQTMPKPVAATPKDAARCTAVAEQVIGALDKGDYAGAAKTFDPRLREKLPKDKLMKGWQSLAAKFGKRASFGQSQSQQINDVTVVVLPMAYEKGRVGAQVACSKQGAVLALQVGQLPPAGAAKGAPATSGA